MTTDDPAPVTITVARACPLGSHTLPSHHRCLTDGGTVTVYCAATDGPRYGDAMSLDWRSDLYLQPGDTISGGWGSRVLSDGTDHSAFFRETFLELARRETRPDAGSRLDAVFTFLSVDNAITCGGAGERDLC